MPTYSADDGAVLSYVDEGQGRPVVFVHGWMMSGRLWKRQLEHFASRNRVVIPDLRGCGESNLARGPRTVERYARDLGQLLDQLDLRDATLVGWSMGGGIVMEYVQRAGLGRVAAIGLVDFPTRLEEDPTVADKVCHNLATRKDDFARGFLKRMFLAPLTPDEETWMLEETRRCRPADACEMYRAMRGGALLDQHEPFPVPALLAFPEKGWFPTAVPKWQALFPSHELPAFPNSKHCPFYEETRTFNTALEALLARAATNRATR